MGSYAQANLWLVCVALIIGAADLIIVGIILGVKSLIKKRKRRKNNKFIHEQRRSLKKAKLINDYAEFYALATAYGSGKEDDNALCG